MLLIMSVRNSPDNNKKRPQYNTGRKWRMAKKKIGKIPKWASRQLALHLIRSSINQKERQKAEKRALAGKKRSFLAARMPTPDMILYQMAGGKPLKVKVKTRKNKDGGQDVKKVSVVRRRKGLMLFAAGLLLKELNKKPRRKRFGII